MEEMRIRITPRGTKIEAAGFEGGECLAVLDKILAGMAEDGIETEVTRQELKAEIYATESEEHSEVRE